MKTALALVFIWPLMLTDSTRVSDRLIVWNVGQGSWATYIKDGLCIHFDSGGDRRPNLELLKYCKSHQHYLSHLDWDHISYLRILKRLGVCRVGSPAEPLRKKKQLSYMRIQECEGELKHVTEIKTPTRFKKANDRSRIFILNNWALIPGDSTKRAEKVWSGKLPSGIKVLLLGHHGSNTSTWNILLENLPDLKLAIASARNRKYGHPHPNVLQRLQAYGIASIRTENWGNLVLETQIPKIKIHTRRKNINGQH